ncbi:hypothetical protein MVES_001632 [Malassezia vespertilionis]|uniref:Rab-GAP TBC domain-containing protein n=1 Tax=Malassezia vespertilionis TaxID=2020962 RepID=A0A2N1JCL6_9BASI|nr:hypothetical protein MVES_001632 [Malassezia vespertilionis]
MVNELDRAHINEDTHTAALQTPVDPLVWLLGMVRPVPTARPLREETKDVQEHDDFAASTQQRDAAVPPPVVELTYMVAAEKCPPPLHAARADLPAPASAYADPYGFRHVARDAQHNAESKRGSTLSAPSLRELLDVYDQKQEARKEEWDAYLVKHAPAIENAPQSAWQGLFLRLRRLDMATSNGKAQWRSFQRMCTHGVPMAYRPMVWSECVRASELAEPGRYQELVAAVDQAPKRDKQITLDVFRTMPTNLFFGKSGAGVAKLQRILEAHSMYSPSRGYCQGMNNIAAILLLTYASEEDAFWAFVGIIETILPPAYFATEMHVAQADQRILLSLVRTGMPRIAAHMRALRVELAAVTYAWFLSLFTIWDILLVDGSSAMFRIAYAILALDAQELLATQTAAAFYDRLHLAAAQLTDADRLIELRASIRASYITTRRKKFVARTFKRY